MICNKCNKWAGAHATLPGQSTEHLCMCPPQRTWVGLTDEELREIIYETGFGLLMNVWFYEHEGNPRKVLQAIEAKLKEKNT